MCPSPLLQIEDQGESLVDPLYLLDGQKTDRFGKAAQIDSVELVAHDQSLLIGDGDWLRATSGLRLPGCCVLDIAIHHRATLATFDTALAAAALQRGVPIEP